MLSGNTPFYSDSKENIINSVINSEIPMKSKFSPEAKNLITRLLCKDPKNRLCSLAGTSEIKNHQFFSSVDWNNIIKNKEQSSYRLLSYSAENQDEELDSFKDSNMNSYQNLTYAQSPQVNASFTIELNSPQDTDDESPEKNKINKQI